MLLKSLICFCRVEHYTFKYKYNHLANYVVSTYVVPHLRPLLSVPVYIIKPSAQIRANDAEGVFQLLDSHDQDLSLDHPIEIRKQIASQRLRNLSVTLRRESLDGFEVEWAGVKVMEDNDSNQQRSASHDKKL